MKTSNKILLGLFLLTAMAIMVAAQPKMSGDVTLGQNGVKVRATEKGVRIVMQLERRVRYPISGVMKASIFDLKNERLAREAKEVTLYGYRENAVMLLNVSDFDPGHPENYILEYSFQYKGDVFKARDILLNLVPQLETRVLGSNDIVAGSKASLRVIVGDATSGKRIEGARVTIKLDGKQVFSGKTNAEGTLSPKFDAPKKTGSTELAVYVSSAEGDDYYSTTISVKEKNRILLVTDKPLYQPGQDMHLRAMALSQPYLKPVKNSGLVFEVEDSKGNKVFKRTVMTDEFGIAYEVFTLADEVNMGPYKVRATLGEKTTVEKTVTVDRYVLPKFKIEFDADKSYYAPGEKVKAKINANYFFGKPVSRGKVVVTASKFDVGFDVFQTIEGTTDAEGHYSFEFKLPDYFVGEPLEQGKARVQLRISVIDGADHEETKTAWLVVSKDPLLIEAIPESGKLVKGVPNRIYIVTSLPGGEPTRSKIYDPVGKTWVGTDDLGIGVIELTPDSDSVGLKLQARLKNGSSVSKTVTLGAETGDDAILLRTDKAIYRAGDEMKVTVLAQRDGTAYMDLLQDGQVVHTAWTDVNKGSGTLKLTIPPDMQGSAVAHAYKLDKSGTWKRDTRRLFIEPATDLRIEVRPDKNTYLPAEDARIDFFVKDGKGRPVPAAIGFQIVDESVFALQEMRPGLEKIYFLLEQELADPKYEIHGFSIPGVVVDEGMGAAKPDMDRAGKVLLAAADTEVNYAIDKNTASDRESQYNQSVHTYLRFLAERITDAADKYYAKNKEYIENYPKDLAKLIDGGFLKKTDLIDPWGNEVRIGGYSHYPQITSAGPDGKFGTNDDITTYLYPPAPAALAMEEDGNKGGRWVGAPPVRRPRAANGDRVKYKNGGHVDMDATKSETTGDSGDEESPRIRSYFPETLWVEPSLITDRNGHAGKTITMADSITTWRLTAMANSRGGALGSATHGIRVFQEFFVDIMLPVALTRNDRVTIPVAIYNYLPGDQKVKLVLEEDDWFTIHGDRIVEVNLHENEVKGIGFDIEVKDVGDHSLTVTAYGSKRSDAVRRSIEVLPDGQETVTNFNGRLEGTVEHTVEFPVVAVPGANKLFVKVYPGLMSQVVEGLDNIFRMPYGCFEQTSSTTYPNILVLDYMQKAGTITPELKMKAEGFINTGYQRLLTFEVNGGGFEWFGNSPAHIILTAYGLMEFHDMSKVYPIDETVITRTQNWLANMQERDGSWKPTQRYLDQVASRFASDVLRNTAYVAWSLAESGYKGGALGKALNYLRENHKKAGDNYTRALIVMALVGNDPKDPLAKEMVENMIENANVEGKRMSFPAGADTAVHGSGKSADVETTALVGLALLKMGKHNDEVSKIIDYLIEVKDPNGTWYSTQATVMSLKLLVGSLDMATKGGDAEVVVNVDGKEHGRFSLSGEKAEILQLADLSEYATTGGHKVSLKLVGEGNTYYSLVAKHYIPWDRLPPRGREPLRLTMSYDKSNLEVNDTVTATVEALNTTKATAHMIILDLGVPPGFQVMTEDLDGYVEKKTIQKYKMTGRQIIVYLEKIDPKQTIKLKYRMKATMPLKGQSFSSRLYEYYNPDKESFTKPVKLEVVPAAK